MAQNITKFFGGLLAPRAVSDILDNQDPKELGKEAGEGLKKAIINQIGDKAYTKLSGRLISWLDGFYMALRKALNEDT